MCMQKTISQKNGGIAYEEKMENILDCMWSNVPDRCDMLCGS